MNELKYLNRVALSYKNLIKNNSSKDLSKKIDFYIEQLESAIETAKRLEEINVGEIQEWAETIQTVYEVDDANTIIQKFELWIMKKFVEYKYDRALRYSYTLNGIVENFKQVLVRLNQIKAFSS